MRIISELNRLINYFLIFDRLRSYKRKKWIQDFQKEFHEKLKKLLNSALNLKADRFFLSKSAIKHIKRKLNKTN